MTRVGIVGLGFIGRMHLATLRKGGFAEVVAAADKIPANLQDQAAAEGNIAVDAQFSTLKGVKTYSEAEDLLADPQVDVALITLPTHLHKEYVLKALAAGKHVICEKPLALTSAEGEAIVQAAAQSGRLFFVAHCIRFWPAYAAARDIIVQKTYGKVLRAHFCRLSPKPTWSSQNWLMDEKRGGGCLLDLHIHDVDFVNDAFGHPDAIEATGVRAPAEGIGDVMATYRYGDGTIVTIEGGWCHEAGFPFRMAFRMVCEEASVEFNTQTDGKLHVYPAAGGDIVPDIPSEDGYVGEHRYFFDCIAAGRQPERVTARSSCDALALIEAEKACIQ